MEKKKSAEYRIRISNVMDKSWDYIVIIIVAIIAVIMWM